MNRILFLVDHKHRDLPSLALIGYFLEQFGRAVEYVALWQELPLIQSFNPRFIVLPKPIYDLGRLWRWKKEGRKTIVIDTEGNPQHKIFRMKIEMVPDVYFFWNSVQAEKYRTFLEKNGCRVMVLGCPRSDFFHENFKSLSLSRSDLAKEMGLCEDKFTVTLPTSAQDSHFSKKQQDMQKKRREKILLETEDYYKIVENMIELRDLAVRVVKKIAQNYPQINLVIKPHPNENIIFWQKMVSSLASNNIKLMVGRPIDHLLAISDLNISFNGCTTTFESALLGIPTVELHARRSKEMYAEDHLELADYKVFHEDEIMGVLQNETEVDKFRLQKPRVSQKLQDYIEKYFFRHDGARCLQYAREIQAFISGPGEPSPRLGLFDNLKLSAVVATRKMKQKIRNHFNAMRVKFIKTKTTSLSDTGEKVDHRGRFDNRIKPGDHDIWYNKYRQIHLNIDQNGR